MIPPYNRPDSDINETPVTIRVKYPCGHIETLHGIQEDLENFQQHDDGTYTSIYNEERCGKCQEKYDEEKWGYLKYEETEDRSVDSDPFEGDRDEYPY